MNKEFLKGTFIVVFGFITMLVPYSLLLGWSLITLVLFWFVITPALSLYLPVVISSNKNHLLETLSGLIIIYGFMIFMIYDHYKTDYFQVMVASFFTNIILVTAISLLKKNRPANPTN